MNVVKCQSGHFYDADKYATCPHCGASAGSVAPAPAPAPVTPAPAPEKKHGFHFGFKKNEKSENTVDRTVDIPDDGSEKTIGIFGGAASRHNRDNGTEPVEVGAVMPSFVPSQPEPAQTEPAAAPAVPAFVPGIASAPAEAPAAPTYAEPVAPAPVMPVAPVAEPVAASASTPVEVTHVSAAPAAGNSSIREELQRATAAATDGKTVGYFNAGGSSEPVVGWLVCLKGEYLGESFPLSAGRNSIGRAGSNDVALVQEMSVSREKHAYVTYEPRKKEFYVQAGDGHSLTYLNDEPVMMFDKLAAYDKLSFGNSLFLFVPLCGENFAWDEYISEE